MPPAAGRRPDQRLAAACCEGASVWPCSPWRQPAVSLSCVLVLAALATPLASWPAALCTTVVHRRCAGAYACAAQRAAGVHILRMPIYRFEIQGGEYGTYTHGDP